MSDGVDIERLGPSWRVSIAPFGAQFTFRGVSVGDDPRADVAVSHHGKHLWRSTSTLSLTGRDKIARTSAEMDSGDGPAWRLATYSAVEAVLAAEENLGGGVDLRLADEADPDTSMLIKGMFPVANTVLVMPNEAGKSTIARALAMSIASGEEIIPGLTPLTQGPVMYVAGEDGFAEWHAKSIAEICRGHGIDRKSMTSQIRLFPTGGRSLAQMARSIAERAVDYAAVFLDSHQALSGGGDHDIRERDSAYWNALDQIEVASFTIAHPNRADRLNWDKADGSVAGTDVNQDRGRCRWKGLWRDDDDPDMGIKRRRYTLENRKWSHGEKFGKASFAIEYFKSYGTNQSTATFKSSYHLSPESTVDEPRKSGRPPTVLSETLAAYRAGARDPKSLAEALGIPRETAKKRLYRLREDLQEDADEAGDKR
jgi:hypothetical protein